MDERESARERCHTEVDGVSIELHAHPAVNLALVHNGVPLVLGLQITNNSDAAAVDIKRQCSCTVPDKNSHRLELMSSTVASLPAA